jgi:hypothetical protein
MPDPIPGRLSTHRATVIVRFRCYADPRCFLAWEEVPEVLKDELERHGWPPCDGTRPGEPDWWCRQCRYGETEELAVIAHQRSKETA